MARICGVEAVHTQKSYTPQRRVGTNIVIRIMHVFNEFNIGASIV